MVVKSSQFPFLSSPIHHPSTNQQNPPLGYRAKTRNTEITEPKPSQTTPSPNNTKASSQFLFLCVSEGIYLSRWSICWLEAPLVCLVLIIHKEKEGCTPFPVNKQHWRKESKKKENACGCSFSADRQLTDSQKRRLQSNTPQRTQRRTGVCSN